MKIKVILIMMLSCLSLCIYAQDGGIKGKVVSRTGRTPINGAAVILSPGGIRTTTNADGDFIFENLDKGEYKLSFEAPEYETLTLSARVEQLIRDINQVIMVPDVSVRLLDDAIFAEYDNETLEDAQSLPSSLSASKDVFNNIASYKFSEMRYNLRGYDSQYSSVYLNGIGRKSVV